MIKKKDHTTSIFPLEPCFHCGHPYEVILPYCPKCASENRNEQDALKIIELTKKSMNSIQGEYKTDKKQIKIEVDPNKDTEHKKEDPNTPPKESITEEESVIEGLSDEDTPQKAQEPSDTENNKEDQEETATEEEKEELWSWNTTFRLLGISIVVFIISIITLFFHTLSKFLVVIFLAIALIVVPIFLLWKPKERSEFIQDDELDDFFS